MEVEPMASHTEKSNAEANEDRLFSSDFFVPLAAIGAAVGLGNFWRFPFVAFENGGGSFLLPYLVVTVFLGLPVLLFEFAIGRGSGKSIAGVFTAAKGQNSWIGWAIGLNCFVIVTYYSVVLAWCVRFLVASVDLSWRDDANAFFFEDVLGLSASIWEIGMPQISLVLGLIVIWGTISWITAGSIRRVENVLKFTVVLPVIVLAILLVRAITLPGAGEGVRQFLSPDFAQLTKISTWSAATTQVLLSLSIGMGQLVAYSARGRGERVVKASIWTVVANGTFSIVAGLVVFATLGYLAHSTGSEWSEVSGGPGLVFVAYPSAIALIPIAASIFGVLFFMMIISLGIDSAFAVIEANLLPLEESTSIARRKISFSLCGIGCVLGIFFTTNAGLFWLDVVDHLVAYYGILCAVLAECIVLGGKHGYLMSLAERIGLQGIRFRAWSISIRFVVPLSLSCILLYSLYNDVVSGYGGYPRSALALAALVVGASVYIGARFMAKVSSDDDAK